MSITPQIILKRIAPIQTGSYICEAYITQSLVSAMKHIYITALLFILLSTKVFAQTFKPISYWQAGGIKKDGIWDMAIDTAGNKYICGYFTGIVDFDPGPGVFNLNTPIGQTQPHAFLQKIDSNGNFVWAKSFGGAVDAERIAKGVRIDRMGDVYVFGHYRESISFDTTSVVWPTSNGFTSPFLAKFSSTGQFVWGYGWANNSEGIINDVAIDFNLNVYLVGSFVGVYDFNPLSGAGNVLNRSSQGATDMFILKLGGIGNLIDVKTIGNSGDDSFASIAFDESEHLYLCGSFNDSIDFDFSSNSFYLSSINAADAHILKIDTALNFKWAKTFGGYGDDYCRKIMVNSNRVIISGAFFQTIDLDPSATNSAYFGSMGSSDIFIQATDTLGNYVWGEAIGGYGAEDPAGLAFDFQSSIYLTGFFEGTVDFDSNPTQAFFVTCNGGVGVDGFVMKIDSMGNFLNVMTWGDYSYGIVEEITSVAISPKTKKTFIAGNFISNIDINPSIVIAQNLSSFGDDDMLFIEIEECTVSKVNKAFSICAGQFQLPSGSIVSSSGLYEDVILSSQGCDSMNRINLVLKPVPRASVMLYGLDLLASPACHFYQWIDCQTNLPIPGATGEFFTPTANGQYAVVVSNGNCTDTSSCYSLTNIGLQEAHLPFVNLYPNPTNGQLHIQCAQPWQSAEVFDMMGRTLITQPFSLAGQTETTEALDLSQLPSGIYTVKVYFKEGVVLQRVVRE